MPATMKGIYHNLKESKYAISNNEIAYFFSSEFYLNKFLNGYEEHRTSFSTKFAKLTTDECLNMDSLADIVFYKKVEKRGFYVWLNGLKINDMDLYHYALRKMTQKDSPFWYRIKRPKAGERFNAYNKENERGIQEDKRKHQQEG